MTSPVVELRLIVLIIHVLAACVWVGGLLTLALVVMPAIRRLPEAERKRVTLDAARRFAPVGWGALVTLVATGAGNVLARGYALEELSGPVWSSQWGSLLALKVVLVAVMVLLAWWHERWFGPRAIDAGVRLEGRKRALMLAAARATVILAVVVAALGIVLSRS
jgi:putative copper export protein